MMYLNYFGFKELPFDITPGVRYFCDVANQGEVLDMLMKHLQDREWFVKLVGEVGVGKTLLCHRLLEQLDQQREQFTTVYVSGYFDNVLSFYKTIAQDLEIATLNFRDSFEVLNLLNERLLNEYKEGKQVVLIIDEAQALSIEILEGLRLISNLETDSHKLVQILLVGQPELDEKLSSSLRQLKERITFSYFLTQLNSVETLKVYVKHRLRVAGYSGGLDELVSAKVLKRMYHLLSANPRKINMVMHRLLLEAFTLRKGFIDLKIFNNVIKNMQEVNIGNMRRSWWDRLIHF